MGCVEGKKCEIRARQERNFEHGAEKREGFGASAAPFLSYGTKYIQACECARGRGDVGGWRKITKYISQSGGCAQCFFCAPVFSLRRLWQIEARNNHTRAFSRGELLSRALHTYIFHSWAASTVPWQPPQKVLLNFLSQPMWYSKVSACSFTGNLSQHWAAARLT